jgi:hypothetical protein
MKLPSLLIVADRGQMLAYAIDEKRRGPVPRLIDSLEFSEGRQKLSEQLTDKAGAFPAGNGQATASAERMTLTAELEMRTFRHIAERITTLFQERHPDTWAFAAPSEINGAILDELDPALRGCLKQNLTRDLTRIPADELVEHFVRQQVPPATVRTAA